MTLVSDKTSQDAAHTVLDELCTDALGRVSFPVDTVQLATQMGFKVRTAKFPVENAHNPVYGVVTHHDGARQITMERGVEEQHRFVSAVLIGADFLHEEEDYGYVFNTVPNRTSQMEFMVEFAMNLLMPGSAVRKLWADGRSIHYLARVFGVPRELMVLRLAKLNLY